MAVTHGLFCRAVVVVELATQQAQPFSQIEDVVEVKVGGTSFDEKNAALRQIAGEPGGNHAACSASTNDDVVKGRAAIARKGAGSHGVVKVGKDG